MLILQIGNRAKLVTDLVSEQRAHRYLYSLSRLQDQLPQTSIKVVQIPYLLEASPRMKTISLPV